MPSSSRRRATFLSATISPVCGTERRHYHPSRAGEGGAPTGQAPSGGTQRPEAPVEVGSAPTPFWREVRSSLGLGCCRAARTVPSAPWGTRGRCGGIAGGRAADRNLTAPTEGGLSGGRTPRSGAGRRAQRCRREHGKHGGWSPGQERLEGEGRPARRPAALLTSTCLALKTMPCAPSPMRPRMQYWSMPAPPHAPPLPAGPTPLPSNGLSPSSGPGGRQQLGTASGPRLRLRRVPAVRPQPTTFGENHRAQRAPVPGPRNYGARCPLPAPPRRHVTSDAGTRSGGWGRAAWGWGFAARWAGRGCASR